MANLIKNILENLVSKPATRPYPFVKREVPQGSRGQLAIDIEKCTFCTLCQKRCPTEAIAVSRQPQSWSFDPYRCIVCGYCVEGCPTKCLRMEEEHLKPV